MIFCNLRYWGSFAEGSSISKVAHNLVEAYPSVEIADEVETFWTVVQPGVRSAVAEVVDWVFAFAAGILIHTDGVVKYTLGRKRERGLRQTTKKVKNET